MKAKNGTEPLELPLNVYSGMDESIKRLKSNVMESIWRI